MRTLTGIALAASLVVSLGAGCAPAPGSPSPEGASSLVREAEAFMASYANDLRTGARQSIVDRYDPRGVYFVGNGRKELTPLDSVRATYLGRWRPPATFEWQDLSYEPAGPDAVVVVGRFVWGVSAERRFTYSYTGLLLRRDGRLRIRVEDESSAPERPASP